MNEQFSLFDYIRQPFSVDKPIRLIETFAGYGSQSMALERLGVPFEHYRVIEFDKYAIDSYNEVHGTDFPCMDICDVKGVDLGIVDKDKYEYLLTYSFPCTDISNAGQQKGFAENSGTRSSLLWEVKRILNELKDINALPQILLMENVSAIHNKGNAPHFRKWLDFLDGLGYSSYVEDLNACDFGVAQNRERTFVLSLLGDYNFKFPQPIDLRYCFEDYFEDMDEETAFQQIVKSEKAMDLLVKLDGEGKLEDC